MRLFKLTILFFMLFIVASPAFAQEMPAPKAAPRTTVQQSRDTDSNNSAATVRQIEGPLMVLDDGHLMVANTMVKLFGIVLPQLSSQQGPQAIAALDELARGQSGKCRIRDKNRDGVFLAICDVNNADLGRSLISRGLAVAARSQLRGTDLSQNYLDTERAARAAALGLWSLANARPTTPATTADTKNAASPAPAQTTPTLPATITLQQPLIDFGALALSLAVLLGAGVIYFAIRQQGRNGLMLAAWQQQEERRNLAAAISGELQAARAVCRARAEQLDNTENALPWPRLRAMAYQANAPRLGLLGAPLARQISNLYGQMADYVPSTGQAANTPSASIMRAHLLRLSEQMNKAVMALQDVEDSGEPWHPTAPARNDDARNNDEGQKNKSAA